MADPLSIKRVAVIGPGGAAADLADGLAAAGLTALRLGPGAAPAGIDCSFDSAGQAAAAVAAARDRLGGLEALVWCWAEAEGCIPAPLAGLSPEAWERAAELPLHRIMMFLKAVHGAFKDQGGRVVLLIPSLAMTGAGGLVPWASAAEGQRSIGKAVARAWGPLGITINSVAVPGTLLAGVPADTPLDRPGLPPLSLGSSPEMRRDVAPVVAGLLSPAFAAVTGTTVGVDGGRWMSP